MNRIYRFLNSVLFRRILIIFIVGLVSRGVVNYVFEINVFKDYTNMISLVYYGCMACFSGYITELPKISFNVFDIKLIGNAIKTFSDSSLFGVKIYSGDGMFTDNMNVNNTKDKDNVVYTQDRSGKDRSNKSGKDRSYKPGNRSVSAGIRGLYGDPDNQVERRFRSAGVRALYEPECQSFILGVDKSSTVNNNLSRGNKVKSRILWYFWKQFSVEYNSYKEYANSLDGGVSIRKEIKKGFSKK